MAKAKLTAGRIERFHCPEDKEQSFLWCDETLGLGVRATAGSARKRYIFQAKVNGKSMRVTIGDVSAWSIAKAQAEARRLQVLIDQGHDPRQVEADREAANKAKAAAQERQQQRETITLGMAWEEYLAARKPQWSERHYQDHVADMHPGGEKRIRSKVPL